MSKKTSIKQFLMRSGAFDRVYDCIASIRNGKITINNKAVTNPNYFFNPKKSLVKFYNRTLKRTPKLYFLINKPAGCLSQKSENEKTIYNLLKNLNFPAEQTKSLFAVGRLDKETEGLLMITNDGKLSNLIMNPKSEITKRYYAVLENFVDLRKIKILEKGIEIKIGYETYKTKPCKIKVVNQKEVSISISEGRKRQIRKMFDVIGNKVVYLRRVSIGGLELGNLKIGEFKKVAREEIYGSLGFQ